MFRFARCLPVALALAAFACTADPSGQDDLAATSVEEDGLAPTAAQVAAALKLEGTLGMSPEAEHEGANENSASVDLIAAPKNSFGDPAVGAIAEPVVLEILTDFASEPEFAASQLRLIDQGGDIHQSQRFGWNDAAAENQLIRTVVPERREEIQKMLQDPDFHAYYYWFQINDVGAEFIGHDLFVIVPMTFDDTPVEAIVVHASYVAA